MPEGLSFSEKKSRVIKGGFVFSYRAFDHVHRLSERYRKIVCGGFKSEVARRLSLGRGLFRWAFLDRLLHWWLVRNTPAATNLCSAWDFALAAESANRTDVYAHQVSVFVDSEHFHEAPRLLRSAEQAANFIGCGTVVLLDGVRVDIHRERRRTVPEAVLHGFDIRAITNEKRGLRVSELMEVQPRVIGTPGALYAVVVNEAD